MQRTAKHLRSGLTAYLMIAPMVILLGIFVFWPLIYSIYLSMHRISFYKDPAFVGFDFYKYVLTDPNFWDTMLTGLKYALFVVPTGIVIALIVATFLKNLNGRPASIMKTTVYVPTVVSSVVASIIFLFIYQDEGLANWFMGFLGVEAVNWLNSPGLALPAIAVPGVWLGLGISTLILLAAMHDIPANYYEAAALDGASAWQRMRYITLPNLKNVLLYLFVTGFTLAIQEFQLPLIMTNGGPVNATTTPNLFIFRSFRDNTEYATSFSLAASLLLFVALGLISLLIFKLVKSDKALDS
ncbi:carbohydrate ABC transporter permease [Catelliglobosispora koreensis]|uniref:carbohydrate ABC transporter permease n=1 Tax=Catelliglobosispora koreensis TaxID=129052 RepID=UPI00035CC67E|nr:sugar ABC transporter permease [Catelliglobosispora koreensis]